MAQLQTVSDIQTEFLVRNNRTTTDGFITDSTLNAWTQESHAWASGYKKWPFTEGRFSTTYASSNIDEFGFYSVPYPEGWKSDAIRALKVGANFYQKTEFFKFNKFFEINSGSDKRIFTDYNRTITVNNTQIPSGTIYVWGQFQPVLDATDKTATTIFTGVNDNANESLVEMMTVYLRRREHLTTEAYQANLAAAQAKLDALWAEFGSNQFDYQTVQDDGMFKRIDLVDGQYMDDSLRRDRWY